MPTELELIALETEFDLYLSFTKRLVLNLPDSDDRTRAAIWLQKLRSIDDDDHKKLRNEHLKLLLFALHRRSLLGVFEKPPHEELESFHDGLTLLEMTRELIELTEKKQASGDNSGESPLPPVTTNVSADLKEYCASQSIPKFGAHVYYAVSNEPIQMWSKSPNCVYPASSDVPNPLQWELTLSKLTDHVLEKQAEAERLAAEAAHDDKTEEKDNTQILPSIDVAVCAGAGNSVFKWKADSILTLHQNYDFSDVGVAEDLEVQGKWQLELDEMAFSILDHSLPGRQKVVVRDPFYQGLPPDIAERRNHGVIDEVEVESTSSSDTESVFEGRAGKAISAFSAKDFSPRDVILNLLSKAGELAKKYLLANSGFTFGIHFENGEFKIGRYTVTFDGDDIVVDFDDHQIKIKGTEGVWRLLTQDTSSVDEMVMYTDEEWVIYMEMMMRAHDLYVTDDDFNQSSDSEEEGDEMSPEIAQFSNYEEQGYEMSQGVAQFSNYQGRGYEMPQGNAQFSNYEGQGYEMPQEASQFSHEGRSMPKKRCAKKRCCSCGKSKRRENPPPPPPCYPEMVQGDQVAPRSLGFEGAPANVDAFAFGLDKIKDKAKEWLPDTPSMPNIPRPSLPGIPNWSDKLPSKPQLPDWSNKLPSKPQLPNWRDKLPGKPELPNWRDKLPSKPELPNLRDKLPSKPQLPNWRDKLPSKPEFPNLHDKLPSMPKLPNWRDKLPSKPEFPNLHDKLPSMPKLPNWRDKLPGKPELPNWRDKLPGKPELPNWRDKLPGKPELPNLRDKLPSMPKLPNLRDKLPNWGGNLDSDDEMPSKSKFGLKWPKLKVGMPKLGLKIPKLPKVPKLGLHLLGFSLSDLGNLIFWKIFEKKQFSYLKALDYLIRRFLEIENLRKAGKIYCIYTGNCLMFWIVEFMIALMGTKGGVKKCMDWTKVCEPLILACDLFNKIAKLFTSEKVDYPICNLREKLASQECSPEEQKKYMKFLKKDAEFENKVRKGVDALGKLFGEDASFLQKLGAYNTLSSMAVSYGIQVAFQHFKGKIFSRK